MTRLFQRPGLSGTSETTFLLDRKGKLIAQNGGAVDQVQALLEDPFAATFLSRQSAAPTANDYDIVSEITPGTNGTNKRIIMLVRLNSGWTLGISAELASIVARFTPGIWRTAALSAVLLLLISGIGILLSRRIGLNWQAAEREVQAARAHLELRVAERTAELNKKSENLRTTLNSIGDAVITTDTQGQIIAMNPVAERLTGWHEINALGKPLPKVFQIIDAHTQEPIGNPVHRILQQSEDFTPHPHTTLVARDGNQYKIAESAAPNFLERYIILEFRPRCRCGGRLLLRLPRLGCAEGRCPTATTTTCAAAVEHLHLIGDDLGGIAILATLVLPLARLQPPLDVDLGTLLNVFTHHLCKAAKEDHPVPFGLLHRLARVFVFPALGGGQRDIGHRVAVRHVAHLGIFPQVTDQDYFVNASAGHAASW